MRKHKLFISYAHEDADMLHALLDALNPELDRLQAFVFIDLEMTAGTEFHARLKHECLSSSAVICLVSNAFLQSNYCQTFEIAWAMQRARQTDAAIIPVILETCGWADTSMRHLRVSPPEGKPVQHFPTLESGFEVVVAEIESALRDESKAKWMGMAATLGAANEYVRGVDAAGDAPRGSLGGLGGALHQLEESIHDLADFATHHGHVDHRSHDAHKSHGYAHDHDPHEDHEHEVDDHVDDDQDDDPR